MTLRNRCGSVPGSPPAMSPAMPPGETEVLEEEAAEKAEVLVEEAAEEPSSTSTLASLREYLALLALAPC